MWPHLHMREGTTEKIQDFEFRSRFAPIVACFVKWTGQTRRVAATLNVRLMVVGSGDSALSAELAVDKELAHWQVVSIDFSSEVTERMKRRFPGLSFLTMDARNLSEFGDGHFGAVLDKGLSDCIGTTTARQQYFQELRRVVVTGGRLIVVSQRVLNTEQDIQEDIEDTESDLGPGWICSRKEILSSLFEESDPRHPPFAKPGTENSIPYFLLRCTAEPFATV
ncbi:unnamed protein product [Effrenium voratum]|nr:unnamed protein product [Effrenium voratum]CAJ1456579.1 unnamed protein product [Effrenium voratum]